MPLNASKQAGESSTSRKGASKPNKRIESGNDTVQGLSSDGHSQEGDDGESNEELELDRKQLDTLFKKASKRDPWPAEFAATVRGRKDAVVKRLKEVQERSNAENKAFEAEMVPLVTAALGGIMDDLPDPANCGQPIQVHHLCGESQPYCKDISAFLIQAGQLCNTYDELAKLPNHESRLEQVTGSFKKDKGVTETTVEAGKKVAVTEIEKLLTDRLHEVRAPSHLTVEDEHKGRLLLARGTDKEAQLKQTLGWGNIAMDTEEAMKELCYAGEPDEKR